MKELRLKGYDLLMYDSIENMPPKRFNEYKINAMLDSGIGSTPESHGQHLLNAMQLYKSGELAKAETVMMSAYQNLQFILNRISPEMACFVCFVYSINGERVTDGDLTEEGVKRIVQKLDNGLTMGIVRDFLAWVKKKMTPNLKPTSQKWPTAQLSSNTMNT
jgi:hypothetical protein